MMGRKLGIRMASKVAAEVGSEFIAKEFDNMTKTSDKIHVLADETLGGTLREYVEVNRRAEVGESVYTIISEEFRKVTRVEGVGAYLDDGGLVFHENYRVLEPTDIVHIDGERLRLVERKSEASDRRLFIDKGVYLVLEPVETSPQSTEDIIANLVRRVAELERMNKEYVEVLSERIDSAKDDIETWAQDVEKVRVTAKYAEAKVHKVIRDVDDLAGEVRQVDDKIEMCIDDIVTLDARTEHVNPIKARGCCGCQK